MKLRKTVIVIASLQLSVALSVYAAPPKPDVSWEDPHSKKGILIEKGLVAGSNFHAFRGTGVVQTNIGKVISILYDLRRANEWVHKLNETKALQDGHLSMVVWQRFNLPWPVKDRDFVYFAEANYDNDKKYFLVSMSDITDTDKILTKAERDKIPDDSCCILGKLIYTSWQILAIGAKSTCVRVEVMFDAKGSVPEFFVKRFLRKWPYGTIRGLQAQALKNDIPVHEAFGNWVADSPYGLISDLDCKHVMTED